MPALSPVRTQEHPAKNLDAVACPDKALALTNVVYLSPFDLAALCGPTEGADVKYVQINGMIFVAGASEAVPEGVALFPRMPPIQRVPASRAACAVLSLVFPSSSREDVGHSPQPDAPSERPR